MNPTLFNALTKSEQYDEDLGLKEEYVPYGSYDYWGGLEYNGNEALLDGSFNNDQYFFEVGAISGDVLHVSTGAWTADGDDATATKVRLQVKPNEYYFDPKCIDCRACYDADGYERVTALVRHHNSSCKMGLPCTINATAYERIAIIDALYEDDANYTQDNNASNATLRDATESAATDAISLEADGALTVGSYEGFFVAPITANYTFFVVWDAALELALGNTADPRSRQVIIGGPKDASSTRSSSDTVD
ncbi:hypothetical protein CTAYLR_005328, partial [Chrysophaeum taylorii]